MKAVNLACLGFSVFAVVACGNQSTQFASAEYANTTYSLTGTSADKTKQIKSALEASNASAVKIESGMSREEQLKADAEAVAILSRAFPPSEGKSAETDAQTILNEAAAASVATEAANAAKVAADRAAKEAAETAMKATAEADAKAAADAVTKKKLEEAAAAASAAAKAAAEAVQEADRVAAEEAKRQAEQMLRAAEEAAAAAAKAASEAAMKAELEARERSAAEAAAKAAAEAADKARIECAAKSAAKAALEREEAREEEERKAKLERKSAEEMRDDDEDKKDFEDDGDFEVSLPSIVVGDDAVKFREACAMAMRADKKNLVIAGAGKGKLKREQVLVVFANGGTLEVKPEGDKIRGLCVFASAGAKVKIPSGKTKINGLYYYERGSNNSIQTSFASGGKFKKGIIFLSGQGNSASFSGVNDSRCKKLKVYGTPGSVTCNK